MKILHFLGLGQLPKRPLVDTTGGIERVALEIARIQSRRGADVTVAAMASAPWNGSWEGVKLRHLQPYPWARVSFRGRTRDFRSHLRLAQFVRFGRFDLVHLHEYRRTRFIEKPAKVIHFHNDPFDHVPESSPDRAATHFWDEISMARAQIGVSAFVGRRLRHLHDRAGEMAPRANICVNQSGVGADVLSDYERQAARYRRRQELGLKDTDVLFMFAGAVRSEKGVVQLSRAFLKLMAEHDNAYLVVAGGKKLWVDADEPTETAELQVRGMLADAATEGRAKMLGIVSSEELPSYYAAADVFLLPSMFQECFGLVILEAFAAGVPVIGARSGGIPELVQDDHNGLLVDQGDIEGLLRAMRRLLQDGHLRCRLGAAGRRTALTMSWENTVDRMDRIYRSVLSEVHQ